MIETKLDWKDLRDGIRAICKKFPETYWRDLDIKREYPSKFVKSLTEAGYLACLIPEKYGGSGLSIRAASVILEDRGGEGRGREQVQVDDARRRGIRVIRRENTYSPISIATLSATPTTCSPRQGSKFLAKLQFSALSRSLQTWCS